MLEILSENKKKLFYKKSSWIQKKKNKDESKWSFQKLNTHNTIKKISLQKNK
jgi:ribosomal protein S21